MKTLLAIALLLFPALASGADLVIETGPAKFAEFELGLGDLVTASDSLPNWEGITSILIVNQSTTIPAEIGLHLASGWTEIGLDAGYPLTIPIRFMPLRRVLTAPAGANPDSVVACVSGAIRVYLSGE